MNPLDCINIIVVDDEPISADEMSDLIRDTFSSAFNLHVRTAYNAAAVLRMTQEVPCDLLVCDIQMPGMSGLELTRTLKAQHPELCVLFLTGYDDFNFAYEAFQQNAMHYILKTEGDEKILQAIEEGIDKIVNRRHMLARIRDAEQRYTQMVPAYRRQLLTQLLLGENTTSNLLELSRDSFEYIYVVIARCDAHHGSISACHKLVAQSTVERTVAESLNDALLWSDSVLLDNNYVWFFSMRDNRECASSLFQLMRKARSHLESQLALPLFFVVADHSVEISQLHAKYLELHRMLSQKILRGAAGAAIRHASAHTEHMPPVEALQSSLSQCIHDINESAFDSLQAHLAPILQYLMNIKDVTDPYAAQCTAALNYAFFSYINQNKLFSVLATADQQSARNQPKWYEAVTAELKKDSQKQIDSAVLSISQYIISYIHEHISENIGTSVLAEVSGYSSGYLSRVFKQHKGISIHEYITQARMTLAKEMLINTTLRIYEISTACGYDNTAYFIKVFKSQYGQTPQEYKQSHNQRRPYD
jgi:two-component system response regulator YesN